MESLDLFFFFFDSSRFGLISDFLVELNLSLFFDSSYRFWISNRGLSAD